jgi:hypothetical protein
MRTQARDAAKAIREMKAPVPGSEAGPTAPGETGSGDGSGATGSDSSSGLLSASPLTGATGLDGARPAAATAQPPLASGSRPRTPFISVAATRFALAVLGVIAILTALGALEITKRPRRPVGAPASSPDASRYGPST